MIKIFIVLSMLGIALAHHPKVRKISREQFQQSLLRKFPKNGLITGSNKERGIEAMMRAKEYVSSEGCNTNVCFSLDAGVFVSKEEYSLQQDFVTLVAAIAGLDERFSVAGVQYGLKKKPITFLTDDVDQFLIDINDSTVQRRWTGYHRFLYRFWRRIFARSFKRSLKFCIRELDDGTKSAKKIFFLGDLRSPRRGARVARRFLPPFGDGAICAVGFGEGNKERLVRFTRSEDRVLTLDQVDEALDILEDVVKEVCGPNEPLLSTEKGFKDKAF